MLVASSPGLILAEVPLLRTAVRRGIRAMAIDPSWDNFTNKLLPVRRVDRLLVWNELMRGQAVEFHGYRPEQIRLCRCAAVRQLLPRPRARLARRLLPRDRRGSGAEADRADDDAARAVSVSRADRPAAVGSDRVGRDRLRRRSCSCACIRATTRSAYRDVRGRCRTSSSRSRFARRSRSADGLAVDVMPEHQRHLADTMRHSDVAVNVASTIAIEACVFDTPVVNIAFDGEEGPLDERSARRYYKFTHYTNITRHHAVRVAWTPEPSSSITSRGILPTDARCGRPPVGRRGTGAVHGRPVRASASRARSSTKPRT